MLSPTGASQYASTQDLQIISTQRKNLDLDLLSHKPQVSVKYPIALQQQSLLIGYEKKLVLKNQSIESNLNGNR